MRDSQMTRQFRLLQAREYSEIEDGRVLNKFKNLRLHFSVEFHELALYLAV